MVKKMELIGKNRTELKELTGALGEPDYRSEQIFEWLYDQQVKTLAEMTNLSHDLRDKLVQKTKLSRLRVITRQVSADRSEKFLFELADGEKIETVYLPAGNGRKSICLSSQAGCSFNCSFCATGQQGLSRNLTAGEIVNQILTVQDQTATKITNVVLMGMGEPLANYSAVVKAIRLINDNRGLNISCRRITLSSCGLPDKIRQLASEGLPVTLAISLHAADNELRSKLLPINKRYPIEQILKATDFYINKTGRRVSFEYALIKGVNDSEKDAEQLATLLAARLAHVNLIVFNKIKDTPYNSSESNTVEEFRNKLADNNIAVTIRSHRGSDIDAACGQLKTKNS